MRTRRKSPIIWDERSEDHHIAYRPSPCTSEWGGGAKRVKHVGTVQRHADRWFWWMNDDSSAGMCRTLGAAKAKVEEMADD